MSDRDLSVLYFDLIEAALSEAARKAYQMLPQGYEFQGETLRKSVASTKAADVLDQWIRRAGTVGSADELFA